MKTHEPPYTADEVIRDLQAQGMIPSKPSAPDRRRIAEAVMRVVAVVCWACAGLMTVRLIIAIIH